MGEAAEFKLAFFGLQPELQAEVRKYLRQNRVRQLELEKLFAVAQDAEVGLTGRAGRRGHLSQEGMTEKTGHKKQGGVMANSVLLDPGNAERPEAKGGNRASDKRSEEHKRGGASSQGSTASSWGSGGTQRTGNARVDTKSWGRARGTESTETSSRGRQERDSGTPGNALCFICDKTGHGWFHCPLKKTGKGCFRCGSESHQFSKCPQRREGVGSSGWDTSGFDNEWASSVFMMETQVMGVEEAPTGSRLLYYPVSHSKMYHPSSVRFRSFGELHRRRTG